MIMQLMCMCIALADGGTPRALRSFQQQNGSHTGFHSLLMHAAVDLGSFDLPAVFHTKARDFPPVSLTSISIYFCLHDFPTPSGIRSPISINLDSA